MEQKKKKIVVIAICIIAILGVGIYFMNNGDTQTSGNKSSVNEDSGNKDNNKDSNKENNEGENSTTEEGSKDESGSSEKNEDESQAEGDTSNKDESETGKESNEGEDSTSGNTKPGAEKSIDITVKEAILGLEINLTKEQINVGGAEYYQVVDEDENGLSQKSIFNSPTTIYPVQEHGTNVIIKVFDKDRLEIGKIKGTLHIEGR